MFLWRAVGLEKRRLVAPITSGLPKDFPNWRTGYQYFQQWSEKPDSVADSLLEEVLKKVGWRGPTQQWSARKN
jgi:hypothetical protein